MRGKGLPKPCVLSPPRNPVEDQHERPQRHEIRTGFRSKGAPEFNLLGSRVLELQASC